MTKIGVGVGEDFPADDSKPAEAPGETASGDRRYDGRDYARYDAEYAARREAYRKWREQRREWKRQWRDEWRARKRAFREQVHQSIYENAGYDPRRDYRHYGHPAFWNYGILWVVLGIIATIAVISFLFSHIFIVVGVIAVLALFAAYHHGYDPFDLEPAADYSRPATPPPAPQPPSAPHDTAQ